MYVYKLRFVLFRPIKKRSFNLLCVLDLFVERWQSTLFEIFFCKTQEQKKKRKKRSGQAQLVCVFDINHNIPHHVKVSPRGQDDRTRVKRSKHDVAVTTL